MSDSRTSGNDAAERPPGHRVDTEEMRSPRQPLKKRHGGGMRSYPVLCENVLCVAALSAPSKAVI